MNEKQKSQVQRLFSEFRQQNGDYKMNYVHWTFEQGRMRAEQFAEFLAKQNGAGAGKIPDSVIDEVRAGGKGHHQIRYKKPEEDGHGVKFCMQGHVSVCRCMSDAPILVEPADCYQCTPPEWATAEIIAGWAVHNFETAASIPERWMRAFKRWCDLTAKAQS